MSFYITKDNNLPRSTLQFLYDEYTTEESINISDTFGGLLSNLNYAWLVRKSRFLVVNCKNGLRVGSWDFGNSLQDDTATVNAVEEIQRPNGKEPHLIISVNCQTKGGLICIFDYVGSKVIRAIQVVEHITNIHVIDREEDLFSLSGPLRNFDGVLAIGTVGGDVYILDICRQLCYEGFNSLEACDEMNPCQMQIITSRNLKDLENHKQIALCNNSHLAIFLNVVHNKKTEHFVLKKANGLDGAHVNKEEVLISALHYCPQLCSILVGYNFGAFQLWDLMSMELVYTSQICEDHIPIIKFAIQEPADDPRAFCYVWTIYSTEDLESNVTPFLVMFALCYETKEFHENYGVLYENFQSCTVRFQRELGFGNNQSIVRPLGGKCLRLDSLILKNSNSNNEVCSNDGVEDALSLCITAWKAKCEQGIFTYMSVFDLNQWYKAQMPNCSNFDDCASFMMTLCISDLIVTESEDAAEIFDVKLHKKTIEQYIGTQRLEEHYHPSSLSFETSCLLEHKIINIQYQGVQKALLGQLQTSGPLCLIRPSDTYQEIVALGLTPLFVELNNTSPITTLDNQREVILNVALEQQLTSWLCKCASEWANGSFSSAGCTLDLLTSWAFRRAVTLKRQCDYLCVPLFDYSDDKLDANTVSILSNCIRQVKNIYFVFSFILNKLSQYLTNKDQISEQCENLQMIEIYFNVLQWFFNVGLLPEYTPRDGNSSVQENKVRIPYPVNELEGYYTKTRSELTLAVNKKFSSKTSALFIDNLITVECGGDILGRDWKKDGGDGFYPPRSLQALLRTYLLSGIEACNKHSIIIYLLLDLAMILEAQYKNVVTHFVKFPAVFKVSPSFIKITQAFWQLDHGEFNSAVENLLDPMVNQHDLKNWHHKVVLKSLLIQEQHNLALMYINVRKPPIIDDEDVLCTLSLFISNNMLDEAFYLEKNYSNSKRIIKHIFKECSNYGRLHSIIYRNLSNEEEEQFLQYLDEVEHPEAADMKITYFMQRSHYIEAFKTYQACEEDPMKKGLLSRMNLKARDQIVHSYKKFLPTVSYKFIESCTTEPNPTLWKEVSRPDPMSVCVQKVDDKTAYKSSLILAALAKAKLTFNESMHHNISLMNATTEEIPFLRTPTVMRSKKRSSVQVIIPKILTTEVNEEEEGPPRKKSKLSISFSQQLEKNIELNSSILSTPIISRKDRSYRSPGEKNLISTPASILKVRKTYQKDLENVSAANVTSGSSHTPLQGKGYKPFISGRKSARTSMVRFDVPSTSSEELSSSLKIKSPENDSQTSEPNGTISFENSSRSITHSFTPKNTSDTEDIYYSPNSSLNNIEEIPKDKCGDEMNVANEDNNEEFTLKLSPEKPPVISKAERVKLVDYDPSSSSKEVTDSSVSCSPPRGRRSYRKLSSDLTPVRSSARLSRGLKNTESDDTDSPIAKDEHIPSPSILVKGNSRKSLNRKVLEANAFGRISSNVHSVETVTTETFREERRVSNKVDSKDKTEISHTKIECKNTSYSCTTIDSEGGESSVKSDENEESRESLKELHEELCRQETEDTRHIREQSSDALITSSSISNKIQRTEIGERQKGSSDELISPKEKISSSFTSSIKPRKSLSRQSIRTKTATQSSTSSPMIRTEVADDKNSEYMEQSISNSDETLNLKSFNSSTISDSFIEYLYDDLCKREYRTKSNSETTKESSSEKPTTIVEQQTPLRITRRSSRRMSEERISVPSQIEQDDNIGEDLIISVRKQTRASSVGGSTLSAGEESKILSSKSREEDEAIVYNNDDSETETRKESNISTTQASSLRKGLKTNRGKYSLSRQVLENNALRRITSSYDTSSTDVKETLDADVEMVEDVEQHVENENDTSLSDSLLELIAFGKTPKEKALLEECRKSIYGANKSEPEFNANNESKEKVHEKQILVSAESIEKPDGCINENENNLKTNVCAISDSTLNVHESSIREGSDVISEMDQLRQENVTPSVFERNISDSQMGISSESSNDSNGKSQPMTKIIEISSSDESESKSSELPPYEPNEKDISELIYGDFEDERTNDLNKGMVVMEQSLTFGASVAENTLSAVTSILDSEDEANKINKEKSKTNQQISQSDASDKLILENDQKQTPRRMTRRLSKQLDNQQNEQIPHQENESKITDPKDGNAVQRVLETSEEQPRSISTRKRTRSVDTPLISQMDETKEASSSSTGMLRARRKLRSVSVDVPTVTELAPKESEKVDKRRKKPSSLSGVENIEEEKKGNKKTLKSIKEELKESYKSTRRLTRKQSSVLEKSLDKVDLSAIEQQDPIELLDKPDFKGTPDPQEKSIYEISPTSSGSATRSNTNRPARRLSRASSDASDDSVILNKPSPSRRKTPTATTKSTTVTRTRRNLRSASTETDKSSGKAKERTPDISDDSAESDTSVLSTSSRNSNKDTNSTKRKRKVVTKSTLAEIKEENSEAAATTGSPAQNTRRGRKAVQK